ncbi:MAG: MFS transporter, partial [Gammaproteobacteria bacterium]
MKVREILALARGYPTRLWLTCFGAYALSQMDLALWSYALPVIRVEFDMSRTGIGVLTGAAFGLGGVALVWLGMLADRIGRKKTMIGGIVAASVFVAAHGLAMNPVALGALRAASMASGGLLYPATGALVAEEAPAKIRGLMTGLLQVAYPLGWFLASMLAVLVLADHGWRVLFIAGLIGLPFALVVKRAVRESSRFVAPAANAPRPSLGALFAPGIRRRTVTLFLAQYFFVIAYGGAFIFSPLYFHEARGFDIAGTATLVGLSNLIGVLGYFLAAWVGEFHLTRRTT